MDRNELRIPLNEFKLVAKQFRREVSSKRPAKLLIAFQNGFASFEVEGQDAIAVRAEGEWHGHAHVPAFYFAAFHKAPPIEDPVIILYRDGKLHVSTLTLGCDWETVSAKVIQASEAPGVLDLLALERTVSRAEVHGTSLGKRISQAKRTATAAVTRAASSLEQFGIAREEIERLVEQRIQERIARG
jgi:hypothetical protein